MAEREQPSPEVDEFERHLSALTPRPQTLDRAALLFQAGKESSLADRRRWRNRERCWQAAVAAMTLLACGLSWHAWKDQPQIVERIRYLPARAPAVADGLPSESRRDAPLAGRSKNRNHYLQQRYVALTVGLDELDGPTSSGRIDESETPTYRDLKDKFFDFQ